MQTRKLITKAASVASSLALLSYTAIPAFAGVTGTAINDNNAADSVNETEVEILNSTTVVQDNKANIENKINLDLNTGGNKALKNNGAGSIISGDVTSGVTISNQANQNMAELSQCGGCEMDVAAGNSKNAADTYNQAQVNLQKTNELFQSNHAKVENDIEIGANTGENKANKNNDDGEIISGNIYTGTAVVNNVNKNLGVLTGGNGGGAHITSINDNNAADSVNKSNVSAAFANLINQENWADIENSADLWLNTGYNNANKNNGMGIVYSGDIDAGVVFDTQANHNYALLEACCDVQYDTGNSKNAADSENSANAKLLTSMQAFQSNCANEGLDVLSMFRRRSGGCQVENEVEGSIDTGYNSTNKNNDDDVDSGMINAGVQVESDTNSNVLGDMGMDIEFPDMPQHMNWWMLMMGMNS